jgi:hypothetical protein
MLIWLVRYFSYFQNQFVTFVFALLNHAFIHKKFICKKYTLIYILNFMGCSNICNIYHIEIIELLLTGILGLYYTKDNYVPLMKQLNKYK